jgi:acetyl-CoA C-acetyltransferase
LCHKAKIAQSAKSFHSRCTRSKILGFQNLEDIVKAVIVSATRTPIGKFLGNLRDLSAPQLGAIAAREAVTRAGIDFNLIEDTIMGQVVTAGAGQNPARQASLNAGMPVSSGAVTVNMVCGSGLKAILMAAQGIKAGDIQAAVAGGMESMSNSPYLLIDARMGLKAGHKQILDANNVDGLWCAFEHWGMGDAAEMVAIEHQISRLEQDEFALRSHLKAVAAMQSGRFAAEIVPVKLETKKGTVVIDQDEAPRSDSSLETLGKLKPVFAKNGTVTAGNAPGLNDAAAALVVVSEDFAKAHGLKPIAEILGYATTGLEPKWFAMTPAPATRKLLEQLNMSLSDIDLFELNEAFAVQSLAVIRDLGIDEHKVNVNGGAVALGHPIGCSGARIVVTLLHALEQQNLEVGLASLCMGGANGLALAVRRV